MLTDLKIPRVVEVQAVAFVSFVVVRRYRYRIVSPAKGRLVAFGIRISSGRMQVSIPRLMNCTMQIDRLRITSCTQYSSSMLQNQM